MKKLLLMLAAVGMIFTACEGNGGIEEENGGNPSIPKIELSQQSIEVDFEPNTYTVSVTSPYSWKAESDNDWIIVKSKTGIAGTETLSFSIERNVEEEIRKGTITVTNSTYNLAAEFYVTQKAISPKITLDKKELNFTVEGGTQEVAITANFGYEVKCDADWLTIEKNENGISVTVPNYVEVDERTAEITISNEKYGISKTVKVAQCAFEPKLDVTPTDINFTIEGGEQSVKITANFEYEVSTTADWVTYTKTENSITVSVPKYVEVKERTAEITISNEKYGISKTVKVSQAGLSEEEYAKRVIFYTTSDNKVIPPYSYKPAAFGANIVSHTYKNGKGIIKFDAPVTSIGDAAFSHCSSLASVIIPDSVTSIGGAAFECCTSLTSVTIPDSVTLIGDYAFSLCNRLTSVTIPDSVTSIEGSTFSGCSSLISISIPDSVTSIGNYAFNGCSSLASVTIPDSVTSIENYAFGYCSSLTSVTILDSVTSIGRAAFCGCSSLTAFYGKYASADKRCLIIDGVLNSFAPAGLTSYTIPDSVTSIGQSAFSDCSSLANVTIPDSVTSIGEYAFEDCSSLRSVYCKPTTPPSGHSSMFSTNASDRKIYVPTASVEAYKSAQYWSDYKSYIVGYDF